MQGLTLSPKHGTARPHGGASVQQQHHFADMVTELMQIRVLLLSQMAAVLRQNHHRYVAANTQSGSKGVVGLEPSGKSALALRSLGLLGPMMGQAMYPFRLQPAAAPIHTLCDT